MTRLLIVGAGGHGKVVADAALTQSCWEDIQFVDALYPSLAMCGRWPVVDRDLDGSNYRDCQFVVAIGDNRTRSEVYHRLIKLGYRPASVIHSSAIVARDTLIEEGVVIFAGATINVGTKLGLGSIVNTGATVDHDCVLGVFCHLSPGVHVAGGVTIGDFSWLGTGVSTKQYISVSGDVIVGVGAAIVSDLDEPGVYVGVPASIKKNEQ